MFMRNKNGSIVQNSKFISLLSIIDQINEQSLKQLNCSVLQNALIEAQTQRLPSFLCITIDLPIMLFSPDIGN